MCFVIRLGGVKPMRHALFEESQLSDMIHITKIKIHVIYIVKYRFSSYLLSRIFCLW